MFDEIFERFVQQCPLAVMARAAMQHALAPAWVDALFEEHRTFQYRRELLFSTVVELMALVALGLRPSLHAAAQRATDLPVSITALYDKVNHTEPALLRALVRGCAARLAPVLAALGPARAPTLAGYRVRIVDGNHLPSSEKRLAPLRAFRGAALPGQALLVVDPDQHLVVDLLPGEDAHTSEQRLMADLIPSATAGDLWIADRNFASRAILNALAARGACFLIREHPRFPAPTVVGARRRIGRTTAGVVFATRVTIPREDGGVLRLRRIELELDTPTTDGDTVVRLLTNLPRGDADARRVAALYLERWTIENVFQRLESALRSEVRTLGQPRAALLALTTAVVAFNVLATLERAVEAAHALAPEADVVSTWFVAQEVRTHYAGMLVALPPAAWEGLDSETPRVLARRLLRYAARVDLRHIRKHPRGPKKPKPLGYAPRKTVERHVATARVLRDREVR
jgi:IS4 transposase